MSDDPIAGPSAFSGTLGLVGTPASGKSTVAKLLQGYGADWIDADAIARQVLHGDDVRDALIQSLGPAILDAATGHLSRPAIAAAVFGRDPAAVEKRKRLEAIVHPPTRLRIQQRLDAARGLKTDVIVLDVPLLFESGWDAACDAILCIDAPLPLRQRWAAGRGWTPQELAAREQSQLSIREKRSRSTWVIDNDGSVAELDAKLRRLLNIA